MKAIFEVLHVIAANEESFKAQNNVAFLIYA